MILFTDVKESFDLIIFNNLSKGRDVLILDWYDYLIEVSSVIPIRCRVILIVY